MRHSSPSILAIDLGTNCGFALLSQGKVVSGTYDMTPANGQPVGMRFLMFENEFLRSFRGVREVYYEEVRRHEGTHAAHIYGAFWGILHKWCYAHDIPCFGCEVAHIKKHVTGRGNANKDAMMDAMECRGYKPADHNEADALALLSFVRQVRIYA